MSLMEKQLWRDGGGLSLRDLRAVFRAPVADGSSGASGSFGASGSDGSDGSSSSGGSSGASMSPRITDSVENLQV